MSLNETGAINWPRMESLTGDAQPTFRTNSGRWPTGIPKAENGKPPTAISAATCATNWPWRKLPGGSTRPISGTWKRCAKFSLRIWNRAKSKRGWAHHGFRLRTSATFVAELLDVPPASVKIGYAESHRDLDRRTRLRREIRRQQHDDVWNRPLSRATDLIEQSLNGRTPTAYDEDADGNRTVNQQETIAASEKQQQLKDRFRRLGLGESRTSRAAGAGLQLPVQQHPAPGFRRLPSDAARNGAHIPPRRRPRATPEERRLADSPGRQPAAGARRRRRAKRGP